MLFVELRFIAFFATIFLVHWALKKNTWRKAWLLGASYAFYAGWDWRFLSLIVISTAVDYVAGQKIADSADPVRKKRWLQLSLLVNLGFLAVFKYFGFFLDSAAQALAWGGVEAHLPTLSIVLPVGISFYTFQTLSYSIDIYRGQLEPKRNVLDFALFVAFFPQLVAGPIVRARDFLPQLEKRVSFANVKVRAALTLMALGFFKKACVGDNVAVYVDAVFETPHAATVADAWIGTLMYGVQIYCDFSGYSDMAIATAALLGYKLCENFDHPYLSPSITVFWRRWHISLSTWLRDYLYISLGGNRGGVNKTYRNLMATMVLGGLWHGAAWTFVVWGTLHGLALIANRLLAPLAFWKSVPERVRVILGWAITFWWVHAAWIFFRAKSFPDALAVLRRYAVFSTGDAELTSDPLPLVLFAHLIALLVLHVMFKHTRIVKWIETRPPVVFAIMLGAFAAVAIAMVPTGHHPFIYFQF